MSLLRGCCSPNNWKHIVAIGVEQKLSNCDFYEHRYLENTNRLYKDTGKCDDQQQYKDILEAEMVSTTEWCTDNSPMTSNPYVSTKNPSERKPQRQFSETLDVKHKTSVCRLGEAT